MASQTGDEVYDYFIWMIGEKTPSIKLHQFILSNLLLLYSFQQNYVKCYSGFPTEMTI